MAASSSQRDSLPQGGAALDAAMATAGGGGGGGGGGARGAVVPAPLCAQHGLPCAFNTTRKPGTVDASSASCGVLAR